MLKEVSLVLFTVLFSTTISLAQSLMPVQKPVYLKSGVIVKGQTVDDWIATNRQSSFPVQVLLQFQNTPTVLQVRQLEEAGISLKYYIPDNAYLAIAEKYPLAHVLGNAGVRYVTDIAPDWKVAEAVNAALLRSSKILELDVSFDSDLQKALLYSKLKDLDASVLSDRLQTMGYMHIALPAIQVRKLARWYGVIYINLHAEDVPLNNHSKALNRGQVAAAPVSDGGFGLRGKGVTIAIGDNTSGIFHVDLADRIINFNPQGYTNHGVHINGIAGGAGIIDPKGEGTAPEARLTNHFYSDVLDATPSIFKRYGVVATNNSYSAFMGSCEYAGTYDGLSSGLDKLCYEQNMVLQVFAAANDGYFDCTPYPQGFATIAGGYQAAKNALIVASIDKLYVNAGNSSRGPVKDGRLKPEITAVGVDVNSTTRNEGYLVASGTSMACPQVTGAAALLTEYWKELGNTKPIRSDLLKALLINGATDIGIEGPDYSFGFGVLNIERSLEIMKNGRHNAGVTSQGNTKTSVVTVPPGVAQLKVLLYWHDEPSSPLSARQLVNDLDIEVKEPGGKVHLPLVLDETPANIKNPATEKVDNLNNCEQVVINNPATGDYTISVKAPLVTSNSQDYVIVYDFVPEGINIRYPISGSAVKADDTVYVYWDATKGSNVFSLEYSANDGATWSALDNSIPADQRYYIWSVPAGINSGKCRLRLTRNGTSEKSVTGKFIINTQPEVQLSSTQCPGYIQIEWPAIPNATGYEVMRKAGPKLVVVDTVSSPGYVYTGLTLDSTYYIMVRPIIDSLSGYRSIAIKRKPTDGDCAGHISDGDIMMEKVLSPQTGRMLTSTELSDQHLLKVHVRNLDDVPCDSFIISYNVDGGSWIADTVIGAIPATGIKSVNVAAVDVKAPGDHVIRLAVQNISDTDKVVSNDTLVHFVSQLPNDPVSLDFSDGFETLGNLVLVKDSAGLGKNRRWDYERTSDTGRLRSYVLDYITINGQYSVSMDAYKSCPGNYNSFIGTFNLGGYHAASDEVRIEFDYVVHGKPKQPEGNEVLARGTDLRPWQQAYQYRTSADDIGHVINSGSVSLSDVMLGTGDDFSASTQVQFGQNDTSAIASQGYGNGVTIDDIRLYTVQNDVQLISVISPDHFGCGITGTVPLKVKLRNGVNQEMKNVSIHYSLDDGQVVSESIASIGAKSDMDFTFGSLLDVTALGDHVLDIWITADGDTYHKNDSILNYNIRNQPVVNTFPYKEDFEKSDGYWFSAGVNNSWAYGKPSAVKINTAASGEKAWVTNLSGPYNSNERSYLYSPCFDLSGLDNPVFSCKLALDIENCGAIICDAAYIDYSTDGTNWKRLGEYGKGTNWYTDSNYQVWNQEDKAMWHQAETYMPHGLANVQLRFALMSDPGANREGIGVDDIEIYNEVLYAPDDNIISISPNPTTDGNINIEWGAHEGTEMKIVMTDIRGRLVYNTSAIAIEGYNKTSIHTPLFSSGMYFMRIVIGEKTHKRKILYIRR